MLNAKEIVTPWKAGFISAFRHILFKKNLKILVLHACSGNASIGFN